MHLHWCMLLHVFAAARQMLIDPSDMPEPASMCGRTLRGTLCLRHEGQCWQAVRQRAGQEAPALWLKARHPR